MCKSTALEGDGTQQSARAPLNELAIRIYFEVGKAASVLTGRRLIQVGNT